MPSTRIWHNAVIPWTRQLANAKRRGHHELAARIQARIDAAAPTAPITEPTVEQAMRTLLTTARTEGFTLLPHAPTPNEWLAFWTLARRGTVNVQGGRVTLADDLAGMDADLLVLMRGRYPELEDLESLRGVGGLVDTVHSLLERGRGT
ncbi:Uncharacterised protein [Mycobacteroides abscessus]|uniref:hypothetical protein n=1 Tax=Mycobacteroides abscessus TaxID=36809 RepID=UPI0005E0352C|nr:hypothetical protein [Mycobacteroides abscessus]CPX20617.1 Uncharacterised protein [Mycobacteroides abscessus]CRG61227.1 Uncharacterised protein [Mycobacteroides abscessus]